MFHFLGTRCNWPFLWTIYLFSRSRQPKSIRWALSIAHSSYCSAFPHIMGGQWLGGNGTYHELGWKVKNGHMYLIALPFPCPLNITQTQCRGLRQWFSMDTSRGNKVCTQLPSQLQCPLPLCHFLRHDYFRMGTHTVHSTWNVVDCLLSTSLAYHINVILTHWKGLPRRMPTYKKKNT